MYQILRTSVTSKQTQVEVQFIFLIRFNKIAIQGTHQMAADKEAIILSRVYSCYSTCNLSLY